MSIVFILLCQLLITKIAAQNSESDSLKKELGAETHLTRKYELAYQIAIINMFRHSDTATRYALQALTIAKKLKDKHKEAACAGTLCVSLTVSGEYPKALGYGLHSLALNKELHDTTGMVFSNLQLMNCYKEQEAYPEALAFGYQAKSLFGSPSLPPQLKGLILSVMGTVFEKVNRFDSTLAYAKVALEDYPEWSGTFLTLGEVYRKKRFLDSAMYYYRTGIVLATTFYPSNVHLIDLYYNSALVFVSLNKVDSALYYALKAISHSGIQSYPEGQLRIALLLVQLYERGERVDSALKYSSLSHQLKDSLYNRKRIREAQNVAFKEKLYEQQVSAQMQEVKNQRKVLLLSLLLALALVIGFLLFRNNRLRQRAKRKLEDAYHTLKTTQAQLIHQEKMASLGELTAGIAHEIQNPLNFVNNFAAVNSELVEEIETELKKGNVDEAKLIVKDIRSNEEKITLHGRRADGIVKGMLQHARASTGKKEPTNINKLADEYLRLSYQGMRAKDKAFQVTIETHFDPNPSEIFAVPQDIGRVLLNLFNNAFYAVSEKQRRGDSTYEPVVDVSTRREAKNIVITVRDNGSGISHKVIDKIFQPFFTTKPTGEGTGLGLSLSYDIVTKGHGGNFTVQSREGEGSEFVIELPVT